jgi:hypothetical protein
MVCAWNSRIGQVTLSKYVAERQGWLFMEIDQFPADGIDHYGLRGEWDRFLIAGDADPLIRVLTERYKAANKTGVVLSFPSNLILSLDQVKAVQPRVDVIYLFGKPELCLLAFKKREKEVGRNLDTDYWHANNDGVYHALADKSFAPYTLNAFDERGLRRSEEDLLLDILVRPA